MIYAVDANDQVLLNAAIRVAFDLSQLRQSLNSAGSGQCDLGQPDRFEPGAERRRRQRRAGGKSRTLALAASDQAKGSKVNVINRLSVATPNQVNLQVRFAEVDRNILKQIGVDWN